jgi:hypothetical protein
MVDERRKATVLALDYGTKAATQSAAPAERPSEAVGGCK